MGEVAVRGLTKRFGDVVAVDDVSLEIADGEFVVLVGPSGCGKSTLLRMIAGLEEITAGTVEIGGRVVNQVPPKDRDIAMVFQSYALYPHMTVRKNLEFALKLRRTPRDEMNRRVLETAATLGLDQLLDRRPKALSGGQRQRVALGRAIVRKPSVFLFDEPLSNLDAKLRVQMRAELTKLHQRLGTTVIYVTHDQVEAMTMGDRIAVLESGRLRQAGPPLDVYERPDNVFVAGFIGTPPMNLLPATIADGTLRGNGFELPVPPRVRRIAGAHPDGEVVIGIRPEHLTLGEASAGEAALELTVEIVETLGHEALAHGRIGEEMVAATLDPHFHARPGERIAVIVALDSIHVFDRESGSRWIPEGETTRPTSEPIT